jgi:hypothetical protein
MEKNRVQMATAISKSNFEDRKLRVDDDFRRDDMIVKGILDAMKIEAQFAVDVNEEEFESENTPVGGLGPDPMPLPNFAQQLMGNASAEQQQPEPAPEQPIASDGTQTPV